MSAQGLAREAWGGEFDKWGREVAESAVVYVGLGANNTAANVIPVCAFLTHCAGTCHQARWVVLPP